MNKPNKPKSITYFSSPLLERSGVTLDEQSILTGLGLRNIIGCENVDTIANKFAAGALTIEGCYAAIQASSMIATSAAGANQKDN